MATAALRRPDAFPVTAVPGAFRTIPELDDLSGLMKTAMIPLWSRAREAGRPHPLFIDAASTTLAKLFNINFDEMQDAWKIQTSVAIRTRILDDALNAHIHRFPECVVINLGAGFDRRYDRVDNGLLTWYDLDLPPLIEIKKQHFTETTRYRMIGKSVLDFSWLDEVDSGGRPVTIIAEGLLMYLRQRDLKKLLDQLVRRFTGAHMLIELLAPGAVGNHMRYGQVNTEFRWSLLNARDVESFNPKIRYIREWCVLDYYRERWQWLADVTEHPLVRNYYGEKIVHLQIR